MMPRWLQEVRTTSPRALHDEVGADLMLKIIGDEGAGIFRCRHFVWKATEPVDDADPLLGGQQWLLEADRSDFSAGKSVIGDDSRRLRHYQR